MRQLGRGFYFDLALAFVVCAVVYVSLVLAVVSLLGCAHVKPAPAKPAGVLEVKIVAMPDRPICYLSERPDPPEFLNVNYDDADIVRRVFVHVLDYNGLVDYEQRVSVWLDEVQRCIWTITGQEP